MEISVSERIVVSIRSKSGVLFKPHLPRMYERPTTLGSLILSPPIQLVHCLVCFSLARKSRAARFVYHASLWVLISFSSELRLGATQT